jgi:hypothetical protein
LAEVAGAHVFPARRCRHGPDRLADFSAETVDRLDFDALLATAAGGRTKHEDVASTSHAAGGRSHSASATTRAAGGERWSAR